MAKAELADRKLIRSETERRKLFHLEVFYLKTKELICQLQEKLGIEEDRQITMTLKITEDKAEDAVRSKQTRKT